MQIKLIEGFEKFGVPILEVYEGGPEVRERIAKASGGEVGNGVKRELKKSRTQELENSRTQELENGEPCVFQRKGAERRKAR